MAKIISDKGIKEELKDGEPIKQVCMEKIGVPFACEDGMCGTCVVEVLEGMQNLSEKNEKEKDMGLAENQRLACQCRIKKGVVKLKY